ncbi:MAG: hypothetical protein IJ853_03600 [Rickettsiales bacterium]|nr:hypothetical protein [Rickettsiales bacterium]
MKKIYYDVNKNVTYTSDTGPLSTENDINNKIDLSQFSGNAEFYIVYTTGNGEQMCEKMYKGNFVNGEPYDDKGTLYSPQLKFIGKFNRSEMISGTSYLNEAHGNKKCYKLDRKYDGKTIIEYFLDGEVVTLTIDKNGKLQWSNITENTKEKVKQLFSSFNEKESWSYDKLLANLALINTNDNIIQYSNYQDFAYWNILFKDQFEDFKKFVEKYKNTDKVITSELCPKGHAVGIIYKDGKFVIIDTSGGNIYDDKEAVEVLKKMILMY